MVRHEWNKSNHGRYSGQVDVEACFVTRKPRFISVLAKLLETILTKTILDDKAQIRNLTINSTISFDKFCIATFKIKKV